MRARRVVRLSLFVASGVVLLALAGFWWAWHQLEASLPALDGEQPLRALRQPAQIHRDDRGVVQIVAASPQDAAAALGFAHSQDRFFQMDVLRRRAAGELAALLGASVVDLDRSSRAHGFRDLAKIVLSREPADRQQLLTAYTEGVNAGLQSLPQRPWEYRLLRTDPGPWTAEDCFLVLYAMALDLQDSTGEFDLTLAAVRDVFGLRAVDFFNPPVGPADGALDGTKAPLAEPPGPRVINLRARPAPTSPAAYSPSDDIERPVFGSNGFAVAGSRTTHGGGLLAGDPHLSLRLPNTWYQAELTYPGPNGTTRLVGATLPGAPTIIIGSNGHVAWTLTNAYIDTGDLVLLDRDQVAQDHLYYEGARPREFERRTATIEVKDGEPVTLESTWTHWGPVIRATDRGKPIAHKWTMHDPAAANFAFLDLANARTVDEAVAIAHRSGIPPQNLIVADAAGQIAWTIAGRIPKRFGFDGRFPVSWTFGDRGWSGYLESAEIPVVRAPANGALWSANQRHLGGAAFEQLGESGLYEGHRSNRIEAALAELNGPVTADDLLAVQLDVQADWLAPWRERLLGALDETATSGRADRAHFRRLVAGPDALHARPNSVGYRLLRAWYDQVKRLTLEPIFAGCVERYPTFNYRMLRTDAALAALHDQEPEHLLAATYSTWNDLRLAAVDVVLERLREDNVKLEQATWGDRNRAAIRHPLSHAFPGFLAQIFNVPPDPLAGDQGVPRVQRPSFGASLRLVVAPGREDEGYFQMPGGQSGHPLSPFYRAGHAEWAQGEPRPLRPGPVVHTTTLQPTGE